MDEIYRRMRGTNLENIKSIKEDVMKKLSNIKGLGIRQDMTLEEMSERAKQLNMLKLHIGKF